MCDLATAAAVIGVASGGAQYLGQRQQAKQQVRYQAQASAAERQRALQEQRSIRMRQAQEQTARNAEIHRIAQKARDARATATVSAGEAGLDIAGLSVDALLDDYTRQEAQQIAGLQQQGGMGDLQTGLALTDAGFRSQNRLIGINRPVNKPSFLTAALDAGSRGLSGYRTGLDIQRSMDKTTT